LFILLDNDFDNLLPFYEHVDSLDDKPVFGLEKLDEYTPHGTFHIVDHYRSKFNSRWEQLRLGALGARVFSNDFNKESPIFASAVPSEDKIRKVSVEGRNAEDRAGFFKEFGVNYIGRTHITPRNVFILDNKGGNRLHDPSKDPLLDALYEALPEDWWGSCGFVSAGNVNKLQAFLEAHPDTIPLAYTSGGFAKLTFFGLDFVKLGEPTKTEAYGRKVREAANRLSYELSLKTT
jgi:hypothetical protein